jgi:vacuolar iron transporter family protein
MIGTYIKSIVYGGVDGTITTFAVVSSVVGASLPPYIILILGFANLLADGVSMAAGDFLSTRAEYAYEKGQHGGEDRAYEEHEYRRTPLKSASATLFSFLFFGVIPLVTFLIAPVIPFVEERSFFFAALLVGLTLALLGFLKSRIVKRNAIRSMLETVAVGGFASLIAYGVGFFLSRIVGSFV